VLSQAQAMNKITLIFALFFPSSAAVADPNAEVRCREIAFSQSNVGVALGRDRARGALQQTPTNQRS
jgi:hypothetical protein